MWVNMQDKFCIFTKFLYDAKGGRKKTDRKDIMHALSHPYFSTYPIQGWGGELEPSLP